MIRLRRSFKDSAAPVIQKNQEVVRDFQRRSVDLAFRTQCALSGATPFGSARPQSQARAMAGRFGRTAFLHQALMVELLPFAMPFVRAGSLSLALKLSRLAFQSSYCCFKSGASDNSRSVSTLSNAPRISGQDVADRLASLKPHRCARSDELPVHCEREGRPIRLDDSGQRSNRNLRAIDRTLHQKANAGLGAEHTGDMERQNTVSEMADRERHNPRIVKQADRRKVGFTVPAGCKTPRTQNFPAVCVGDRERQAPVGETVTCRIHPDALHRSWSNLKFVAVDNICG